MPKSNLKRECPSTRSDFFLAKMHFVLHGFPNGVRWICGSDPFTIYYSEKADSFLLWVLRLSNFPWTSHKGKIALVGKLFLVYLKGSPQQKDFVFSSVINRSFR